MRTFWLLSLICLLVSCSEDPYPGFKKEDDFYFKVHELGDEKPVDSGNYIMANIIISSLSGDTVHYVPDYPYFLKMDASKMANVISNFQVGDSISVILEQNELKDFFNFFHLSSQKNSKAILNIRICKVYASDKVALKDKKRFLEKRKIDQEKAMMKIIQSNSSEIEELDGVYREIIEEGHSLPIGNRSIVDMHYKGKFTNGYVFDDTYERNQPLSFTYGQQQQVIKGVDFGIKDMKEGNKFKIYIPSHLAFGSKGSLAGIVPPNTSIIYEIEIIKVRNQ